MATEISPQVEISGRILYNIAMHFKVVETSTVTDVEIERILNEWTGRGYSFASIHFVTNESSRRPGMAFVFFTGTEEGCSTDVAGRTGP